MCADYSNKQFPGGSKGGHVSGSVEKGYSRASSAERAINIGTGSSAKGPVLIPSYSDGVVSSYDFGPKPERVQGPPWLFAYPLFDGDSYELNRFFEERILKFGEASADRIILIDIGNPSHHDDWYRRLRNLELEARDGQDTDTYVEQVYKPGNEKHHRLREMERLREILSIPHDHIPCIAFRTEPIWKPVPVLRIEPYWYNAPEAHRAFSQALQGWLSTFQPEVILREGMTNEQLAGEIETRLPELHNAIKFAVAGEQVRIQSMQREPVTAKTLPAIEPFPTPRGAAWQDVEIRFRDGETVSIKVKSERRSYNFAQMGMINRKNSQPTIQWKLLLAFSACHGEVTWNYWDADFKNQKRREKLAKDLQRFFGIEGDPFKLTKDRKGWRASFQIWPEG